MTVSVICTTGRRETVCKQVLSKRDRSTVTTTYLCFANGTDNHSAPLDVSLAAPFYLLFVFLKSPVAMTVAAVFGLKSLIREDVSFRFGTKVFWLTVSKYGNVGAALNSASLSRDCFINDCGRLVILWNDMIWMIHVYVDIPTRSYFFVFRENLV